MRKGKWIVQERKVFERKYQRLVRRALLEQVRTVLEWNDYDGYADRVDRAVSEEPIRTVLDKLYLDTGSYFARRQTERLTKGQDDVWEEEVRRFVRTKVGDRITWITEETGRLLKEMIRASVEYYSALIGSGTSTLTDAIQDDIRKEYGEIARWRAMRIAQTETMTAQNLGSRLAAEQWGIDLTKSWMVSGVNTRDSHYQAQADNQQIPMDQPFIVSGVACEQPGDPSLPAEEVINCGCYVVYEPVKNE